MTGSPMARLGTSDSTTRGRFIAERRRYMVQWMLEVDEKAVARRITRSTEALVLQNPTRALAALVLDAGITTAEARALLGL